MAGSPTLTDVPVDRSTSKELRRVTKKLDELMIERRRLIFKAQMEGVVEVVGCQLSMRRVRGALPWGKVRTWRVHRNRQGRPRLEHLDRSCLDR